MNRRQFIKQGALYVPAAFMIPKIANAQWSSILGASRSSAPTYDFQENFETPTTGYQNTGWTTAGAANPAYSTSPAPLLGTQSLYTSTGTSLSGAYRSRAATGEVWLYWVMYCITGVVDDTFFFGDSTLGNLYLDFTSGKMRIRIGGSLGTSASAFPLDQMVHVWFRYQPGSGTANADLYYSTDGVRGTPKASVTGATSTLELDRPYWHNRATYAYLFDRIIINSTAIGDNPS